MSQMQVPAFNALTNGAALAAQMEKFRGVPNLSADTARALMLLGNVSAPTPSDPAKQAELAKILAKMQANYGAGKWCRVDAAGNQRCLTLQERGFHRR